MGMYEAAEKTRVGGSLPEVSKSKRRQSRGRSRSRCGAVVVAAGQR